MSQPIYIGFSVLDMSKELMYAFHYHVIKQRYGNKAQLLFTDTDSLMYLIETPDLHADMWVDRVHYDFSTYPIDHRLYSIENQKVVGKFRDEMNSGVGQAFVALKSKLYALMYDHGKEKLAAKGIKRSFVKNHLNFEIYLNVLKNKEVTRAQFLSFKSTRHTINTVEINKICLSAFDAKRYILEDGISSLAYGHKAIPCNANVT